MTWIVYDGKTLRADTPLVTAASRALRYGDGLFETIKMQVGKLHFADGHFSRLTSGMELLGIENPPHFNPGNIINPITELSRKNSLGGAARVRLNVFRGEGGLYDPVSNLGHYIIETFPLPASSGVLNENGLVLGIYSGLSKPTGPVSNLKHNNCLPYILGGREAKSRHWNEAVILNSFGRVCETTIANIFIIRDKQVVTPALSEGCVAGIIRAKLLEALPPAGWEVKEGMITIKDLKAADEIFLTNSIHEIRWVGDFDGKQYPSKFTREIYQLVKPTICP